MKSSKMDFPAIAEKAAPLEIGVEITITIPIRIKIWNLPCLCS